MSSLREPGLEKRRRAELSAELFARAKVWMSAWRPADPASDFAGSLFAIAARFESEVAQRLDKMPEKMYRGFLQWLGVRGSAAQAARLPLVFGLTPGAQNARPVLAQAPIQAQATPPQTTTGTTPEPVTFETEDDLMIVPGSLVALFAADPENDAFFKAPLGFSALQAPVPGPDRWTVATIAKAGSTQIQLTPTTGLDSLPTLLHAPSLLYRVTKAEGGLVTVDPPVGTQEVTPGQTTPAAQDLQEGQPLTRQKSLDPFGTTRRNLQEHAVYIGSETLLNLPTSAKIGIKGITGDSISWFYWGKSGNSAAIGWQKLTPNPGAPILTLSKDLGSVEITTVGGKSSRWLKGTVPAGSPKSPPVPRISLTINPKDCGSTETCPPPPPTTTPVALDGMANTTPLVLNTPFYPLGREPRLFDTFYIGCVEAFSKANASVCIRLQALDGTATSFTAAQSSLKNKTPALFGIGSDGFLHRMRQGSGPSAPIILKTAVRPPHDQAGRAGVNEAPSSLNWPQGRLSVCTRESDSLVAVVADKDVWVWSENPDPDQNGKWYFLGTPLKDAVNLKTATEPKIPATEAKIPAMLLLTNGVANPEPIQVVALIGGALYETSLAKGWETAGIAQWTKLAGPKVANPEVANPDDLTWACIAPVFDQSTPLLGAPYANGWIAVATNGSATLFRGPGKSTPSMALPNLGTKTTPLVIRLQKAAGLPGPALLVSATPTGTIGAWTIDYDPAKFNAKSDLKLPLLGDSLDWTVSDVDGPGAVFATKDKDEADNPVVAVWYPLATTVADPNIPNLSPPAAELTGSPAVISDLAVAPGANAGIGAFPFNANGLAATPVLPNNLATAMVVENAPDHPKKGDIAVVKDGSGKRKSTKLKVDATAAPAADPNRYWIAVPGSGGNKKITSMDVYRPETATYHGTVDDASPNRIVASDDPNTHAQGDVIAVTFNSRLSVHSITNITTAAGPPATVTLTINPKIYNVSNPGQRLDYQYLTKPDLGTPSLLPLLTQNLAPDFDRALNSAGAYFRGAKPRPHPLLFADPKATPAAYVFKKPWEIPPTTSGKPDDTPFSLVKDALFGAFNFIGGAVSANPALSWEYFDGNAWWKIPNVDDRTSNLRSTGTVSFCVPSGLQQTDVAGKKSYWIRARLVGGDYGQETVTIHTVPDPATSGGTIQTIDRSQAGIDPPLLGAANVTYSMCCETNPDFVLTSDGGTTTDQTAVNNASSSQISLFVPLSTSIGSAVSGSLGTDDSGPALYLGFDGPIQGGPINILFLVKNQDQGAAYPLRVDVLREKGFAPITSKDGTRGLGESGILSLYIPELPPVVNLFGSNLRWLRLRPNILLADTSKWTPVINNAYVNAVYARASETQEREKLGSSDGSPGQQVTLARPPVLEGSLEIRVLEPLSDEELTALKEIDPNNVLTTLDDQTEGKTASSATPTQSWVLWTEVDVIEAAGKIDRFYELDNDSGEITFGDGIHGMIPPIGTDSIVARVYKRGGGSTANKVKAWSAVNLISPIQGVSQVVAPDDAAGGSDPQTPDEILRLAPALEYMRDHALTLRDFEMLAVQSSRDIVQARALRSGSGVRLIAVARGSNPEPTQAQSRALLAYLTNRCFPSFAAPNAIDVVPPRLIQVQLGLKLEVESIELSGSVAQAATDAIVRLFDAAAGGFDKQGWPLGVLPTEADMAAALADIPHLLAIDNPLTLTLTYSDVAVQTALPQDLPVADAGDIQIDFQVTAVEVGA